jgi:hypothetical protein
VQRQWWELISFWSMLTLLSSHKFLCLKTYIKFIASCLWFYSLFLAIFSFETCIKTIIHI